MNIKMIIKYSFSNIQIYSNIHFNTYFLLSYLSFFIIRVLYYPKYSAVNNCCSLQVEA